MASHPATSRDFRSQTGPVRGPVLVKVWDPVVRLFHWTVVTAVMLNLLVLNPGGRFHRWTGYVAAAALLVRVIWGFVGTRHARFAEFVPGPRRLIRYLRDLGNGNQPHYLGHNPAGAVMMLALMGLLAVVSITGYMTQTDTFWGADWVEELHSVSANLILVLALVHALAALYESWNHRENLVWAMITGRKRR